MIKKICFDMDGTIADLYGVKGWLEDLQSENTRPYEIAKPLVDMNRLGELLTQLRNFGVEVVVITWLAMNSTKEYDNKVRQAKLEWLEKYNFPYTELHMVKYGTTKANTIRKTIKENEQAILFDDNEKIRKGWHLGGAYDVDNIIETICGLF